MKIIPPKLTIWLSANKLTVFFAIVFVIAGNAFIYFWQDSNLWSVQQNSKFELSVLEKSAQKNLELNAKVIELERQIAALKSKNIAGIKNIKEQADNTNDDEGNFININLADAAKLDELPGIGPAKAQAIIDYRKLIGKYTSKNQLLEVKGIGQSIFAQIAPLISL